MGIPPTQEAVPALSEAVQKPVPFAETLTVPVGVGPPEDGKTLTAMVRGSPTTVDVGTMLLITTVGVNDGIDGGCAPPPSAGLLIVPEKPPDGGGLF